jgi:hypothetical protein
VSNSARMPKPFRCIWLRRGAYFVALLALSRTLSGSPGHAEEDLLKGVQWGESQSALLAHFGARVTVLPSPIDFGDSYTQIVLRNFVLGGVPLIAFFQIDKATQGLKRIQLERQRHGVNPPAFRGVIGGLEAKFGIPDAMCRILPGPRSGYQAAAEFDWSRGNNLVRAVLRDTTIEAVEGCLSRDLTAGPCGLTGQLFVRISPPGADAATCPLPR